MNLFEMIDQDDCFTLACLIAILTSVGTNMASPNVRQWGKRAAAVASVLICIYAGCMLNPTDAQDCLHIAFRGLFAAGLALGITWIVLSISVFAFQHLRTLVQASWLSRGTIAHRTSGADRLSREEARRQQADNMERERRDNVKKADAARRRDDARMRCLMLYDRHSTTLAERFPRERLQEYFDHYMSDKSPPEVVEERARTLVALIDEWVAQDKTRQKKEFRTLEELAAFFQKQRDEVAGLSYDADIKDSFLTNINIQEEQAVRRFLAS